MKKLFFLLFTLFFFINVHAETLAYNYKSSITVNYWGTTAFNHIIYFSGTPSQSSSYLQIYNYEGITLKNYNYFIVAGCRHGNDLQVTVSTRSSSGRIANAKVFNSLEDCNDGYAGKISYIQYQVVQWADTDGTWEELYADANSVLYGQSYFYVMDKFFSTEDMVSQLIQGQLNYNIIQEQISQSITNTNNIINSQNNINNTITDSSTDNPSNDIASFNQYLASNSTITSLIVLPVTLYQKMLNSLNATCSSYDAGELLGTHIVFPCINISNYIGSTLWNVIDVLMSGFLIFNISKHFIKVFDNMSSMKDGDVIND